MICSQAFQFAKESSSLRSLFDVYCVLAAWRPLPAALPTLLRSWLIILANSLSKRQNRRAMNSLSFIPASSYVRVVPLPRRAYKKATERGKENKTNKTLRKCSLISVMHPTSRSEHNATKAASGTGLKPLGIHVLSCGCFNMQTYPKLVPAKLKRSEANYRNASRILWLQLCRRPHFRRHGQPVIISWANSMRPEMTSNSTPPGLQESRLASRLDAF